MTAPTRHEIIDAREALAELRALAENNPPHHDNRAEELENRILTVLPSTPPPTMADMDWDEDKHYLAEARHNVHGQVIMVGLNSDRLIEFFIPNLRDHRCDVDRPDTLTPTGRRYTLAEM